MSDEMQAAREKFEAWAVENEMDIRRMRNGEAYSEIGTWDAWHVWQKAQAAISIPAAAALLRAVGWTVQEPKCETCGGSGRIMNLFDAGGHLARATCPTCNGTGKRP